MVDHKNSKTEMTNNHLVKLYCLKDIKLHKKTFHSYVSKTHKAINYSLYIYNIHHGKSWDLIPRKIWCCPPHNTTKKSLIIITLTNKLVNAFYCTLYQSPNDSIWGHYHYWIKISKFLKSKKKCQLIITIQIIITSTTLHNHISQNNMCMLTSKELGD
jgi:hypothetical protein